MCIIILLYWLAVYGMCDIRLGKDLYANRTYSTLDKTKTYDTHLMGSSLPGTYAWPTYTAQIYFTGNWTHGEQYFSINTSITSSTHIIRSNNYNTYWASSSGFKMHAVFASFLNGVLNVHFDSFDNGQVIYNCSYNRSNSTAAYHSLPNYYQTIHQVWFVGSQTQVIVLIYTPYGYVLKYLYFQIVNWTSINILISTDILLPASIVNITNSETYLNKVEYNPLSNKIFIAFSMNIVAYSADYLLKYGGMHTFYVNQTWSEIDFSISTKNTDLFCVWQAYTIQIFNVTTWQQLGYWRKISQITTITIGQGIKLDPPYVYLIQGLSQPPGYYTMSTLPSPSPAPSNLISYTHFIQYDFAIQYNTTNLYEGAMINYITVVNQRYDDHLQFLGNQIVVYFDHARNATLNPQNDTLYLLNFDSLITNYPNLTCPLTYTLNSTTCYKSNNILPMSQPVTPIKYSTSSNQTEQQMNVLPIVQALNNQQILDSILRILAKIMPYNSALALPQCLFSLIMLLDDLWYYKFHWTVYPLEVQFFIQKVDTMSYIRFLIFKQSNKTAQNSQNQQDLYLLSALFLDQQQNISNWPIIRLPTQKDHLYMRHRQHYSSGYTDPDAAYYFNANLDIFTNQLLFNFILFAFLKIAQFVVYYFSIKFSNKFTNLYLSIRNQTKMWTLIVAVIDTNMIRIIFSSFIQMSQPFCFSFIDKLNMLLLIIILYIVLSYSLIFYCIVYQIETSRINCNKKRQFSSKYKMNNECPSKILLMRSKDQKYSMRPYVYESISITFRNLMRAFIHSYFLYQYPTQITLLCVSDIFWVIMVLFNRKLHINNAVFIMTLAYYVLFLAFDTFYAIKTITNIAIPYYVVQVFSFSVLSCLVLVSVLQMMYKGVLSIISLWKFMRKQMFPSTQISNSCSLVERDIIQRNNALLKFVNIKNIFKSQKHQHQNMSSKIARIRQNQPLQHQVKQIVSYNSKISSSFVKSVKDCRNKLRFKEIQVQQFEEQINQ